MRNFITILYLLVLVVVMTGCKSNRTYTPIVYKSPYKFKETIEKKLATDTVAWKHQISAGEYALKGDYKNALQEWDLAFAGSSHTFSQKQIDSLHAQYTIVEAIPFIVEQAKSHQVVIINEAHHNSAHRVFTKKLLQQLYDHGYKHVGLEALTNGKERGSLLNTRGYPIKKSGYYIQDPNFGNLVRTALKKGYTMFPYEGTSTVNGKEREIEQAKNIQRIINQNPSEKVVVHVGFDHVLEGHHKSWEKAMAERLHEYTGINPLTINQTKYSERSIPALNAPLLKAFSIKTPAILLDNKNNPLSYSRGKSFTDIAVIHPKTHYRRGRPHWLFDSQKKEVPIQLKDSNLTFPVMVLAYVEGEAINQAIPTDIIELQDKQTTGYLALKKGTYSIVATNTEEQAVQFQLQVK